MRTYPARVSSGLLAMLVCATVGAGCGYSLAGRGSFLPSHIRTIGVPTFTNRTQVFNVETQLTQKVRSEFIGRGRYRIVPETTGVDAILSGVVVSVVAAPVGYDEDQLASRFTVTMSASVSLRDVREEKVLWESQGLVFRQEYDLATGAKSLDAAAFFGQDANALDRLTTDFARTIVSAILEAF